LCDSRTGLLEEKFDSCKTKEPEFPAKTNCKSTFLKARGNRSSYISASRETEIENK